MLASTLRALWAEPRAPAPPRTMWWDRALVAGLIPVTALEAAFRPDVASPLWQAAWALICVATLLWRPHHPLAMLILAYSAQTVAGVVPALLGVPYSVLDVTAVVLLLAYSLGRWASGRGVVAGSGFLLVVHLAREPLYDSSGSSMLIGVAALMLPVALGALMRFWARSQLRAREDIRMRERERLARDLHDTVAHNVSGILMQARAAKVRARTDPGASDEALDEVAAAAVRTLDDMRAMVAVLRTEGEVSPAREPAYAVTDIPLLARDDGPGPRIDIQISGDVERLPAPLGSALFRAVQEAVTNARQHAVEPTLVSVDLVRDQDTVRLRVHDDGKRRAPGRGYGQRARPSYGLAGMRERFSLLGGDVRAGQDPTGGWTVEATVPVTTNARGLSQ